MKKISEETIMLLEKYFDAANNLYGIVPLSKILSIYNSQNEPIEEDAFLDFVEKLDLNSKFYCIVSEDELFDNVEPVSRINKELVAEYILLDNDLDEYIKIKGCQMGKPYYVPEKEKFLKYADELYCEKTLSFISLRAFFRNQADLTKDIADSITEDICAAAKAYNGDIDDIINIVSTRFELNAAKINDMWPLLDELVNDTRLNIHCGHTARELENII